MYPALKLRAGFAVHLIEVPGDKVPYRLFALQAGGIHPDKLLLNLPTGSKRYGDRLRLPPGPGFPGRMISTVQDHCI